MAEILRYGVVDLSMPSRSAREVLADSFGRLPEDVSFADALRVLEITKDELREEASLQGLREVEEITREAEARGIKTSSPLSEVLERLDAQDEKEEMSSEASEGKAFEQRGEPSTEGEPFRKRPLSHEELMRKLREEWFPSEDMSSETTGASSEDTSSGQWPADTEEEEEKEATGA